MKCFFNFMRIMFILNTFICLTSCREEEEVWDARKQMAGWGIFDGVVNGEEIHLKNTHYNTFTSKKTKENFTSDDGKEYGGVRITVPSENLHFDFKVLNPAVKVWETGNESMDNAQNKEFETFVYNIGGCWPIPSEIRPEHPAKFAITNIEYRTLPDGSYPYIDIIEGDVDAVYYTAQGVFSIKGHFATK